MAVYRIAFLAFVLLVFSWFRLFSTYPASAYYLEALDYFDAREAKRVLIIGNSRSYYNDMPQMLRKIADSNGSAQKYQIVEHLLPGEQLSGHWKNPRLHKLIEAEKWDEVIIQAQSSAHYEPREKYFHKPAALLANKASENSKTVRLLVTWTYAAGFDGYDDWDQYYDKMQADHAQLAQRTGSTLTNVGRIWKVHDQKTFSFPLYIDGNHPSVHGSYLTALALFADMEKVGPKSSAYRPGEVSEDEAELIRAKIVNLIDTYGDI